MHTYLSLIPFFIQLEHRLSDVESLGLLGCFLIQQFFDSSKNRGQKTNFCF